MPDMYAARRWGRNCFVSGGGDFDIAAKLVADEIKTMQEAQVYISNFVIARAHKHEVLYMYCSLSSDVYLGPSLPFGTIWIALKGTHLVPCLQITVHLVMQPVNRLRILSSISVYCVFMMRPPQKIVTTLTVYRTH